MKRSFSGRIRTSIWFTFGTGLLIAMAAGATNAGENPEISLWGESLSRNLVSAETGVPTDWDARSGRNIKWSAALGSQSYAGPLLHGGKIFVGTNNQSAKNPAITGDRGNIMAFNLADGAFLWQSAHPKHPAGRVHDWPQQGICSTPYAEGDRIYYISNLAELICADTEGFRDGENDGAVQDEENTSDSDVDIVWKYDLMEELAVFPHNLATSSPLGVGDLIYIVSGNGVDEGHVHVPTPFAPSFLAFSKTTGELVWEDSSPGESILHGQWSNPSYGVVNGQGQVIFPGGDGWVYALNPLTGELIWKFDCNPKDSVWELGGRGTRNNLIATPVILDNRVYIGVGQDPEHGESIGHLWAIDATQTGDITESGRFWHFGDKDFNRTMSTVAIHEGLLYVADLSGYVYCLDAATGKQHWKYDTLAAIWGSPYVVEGKVYIGDEDGDVTILKTGTELELLAEINLGSAVYTTPVTEDGVLYIVTRNTLYAIQEVE
jgi:outer membrane protein assembly factor BamB